MVKKTDNVTVFKFDQNYLLIQWPRRDFSNDIGRSYLIIHIKPFVRL